jgi:flagellar basal body-associated protein FliL
VESATAEPRERDEAAPQPRRRRRWWIAGGVLALLAALAVLMAVTWHFSSIVLVPDHDDWPLEAKVEAVKPGRITLSSGHDSEQPAQSSRKATAP